MSREWNLALSTEGSTGFGYQREWSLWGAGEGRGPDTCKVADGSVTREKVPSLDSLCPHTSTPVLGSGKYLGKMVSAKLLPCMERDLQTMQILFLICSPASFSIYQWFLPQLLLQVSPNDDNIIPSLLLFQGRAIQDLLLKCNRLSLISMNQPTAPAKNSSKLLSINLICEVWQNFHPNWNSLCCTFNWNLQSKHMAG